MDVQISLIQRSTLPLNEPLKEVTGLGILIIGNYQLNYSNWPSFDKRYFCPYCFPETFPMVGIHLLSEQVTSGNKPKALVLLVLLVSAT